MTHQAKNGDPFHIKLNTMILLFEINNIPNAFLTSRPYYNKEKQNYFSISQ